MQAWRKLEAVDLHTSRMTVVTYLVLHSGKLSCLRLNISPGFFMATTNIIWSTWQRTIRITKPIMSTSTHLNVTVGSFKVKGFTGEYTGA